MYDMTCPQSHWIDFKNIYTSRMPTTYINEIQYVILDMSMTNVPRFVMSVV